MKRWRPLKTDTRKYLNNENSIAEIIFQFLNQKRKDLEGLTENIGQTFKVSLFSLISS